MKSEPLILEYVEMIGKIGNQIAINARIKPTHQGCLLLPSIALLLENKPRNHDPRNDLNFDLDLVFCFIIKYSLA
jgi:hypothetical protein